MAELIKLRRQKIVLEPAAGVKVNGAGGHAGAGGVGARARFNPAVLRENDRLHLLFRATNGDIAQQAEYISEIGYAQLDLEGNVLRLADKPFLSPAASAPAERRGCEDPRLVEFEGRKYIFYTAYDGRTARVAIATTTDFERVERFGVIDLGPSQWDKDAFIFPGRVQDGKIAYLHRIEPSVELLLVNDVHELLATTDPAGAWQAHLHNLAAEAVLRPEFSWEDAKVGAGAPPVLTEAGWVLIYHGVDHDRRYRAGVALLDRENPRRVLARLPYPILEPEEPWEREGDVPNVVFPEGVAVVDGVLQVYYGAADKRVGLATVELAELVAELQRHPWRG